ncbi:MAG: hypothetical protein DRP94_05950 [Candidatus Latescibacterota bacterium]|nr:MAG: hypothetical protein DRP94_05950 [Candidatus Latescibacterota bacterium]
MRIGYVTTCPEVPVGGVSVIFWHVALLREMGIEAFVVPDKASTYDPWWMVPKPKVKFASLEDEMDVWVVPEVRIDLVRGLKGTKVAFVQNHGLMRNLELYKDVSLVLSVSEPSAREIEKKVDVPVLVVNPFIHPSSPFRPGKKEEGKVLVLSRKKTSMFYDRVLSLLKDEFKFVLASCMTQKELSELYSSSEYYLHLSFPEGWPAPVAEAMKSGCCVVGFSGTGGLEFMKHLETAYVAPDGDVEECVRGLRMLRENPDLRRKMVERAMEVAGVYTPERTKNQLAAFVERLSPKGLGRFDRYIPLMEKIVKLESRQAEEIGEIILRMFRPKSVIDLGCGPGIYLLPFKRAGCRVLGVDACPEAGKMLKKSEFVLADLTRPFDPPFKADVCICFEVGEHIDEGYSAVLVENCTRCADTIVWSAARPGQAGFDHKNCQWLDFWWRLFEIYGFTYDRDLTKKMKDMMFGKPGIEERKWLIWNGAIFRRQDEGLLRCDRG